VDRVYLVGKFARGLDSQIIDLVFIGAIEKAYLLSLVDKVESIIKRKVRYLIYTEEELEHLDLDRMNPERLLLWSKV